jgi:hypothetical protein
MEELPADVWACIARFLIHTSALCRLPSLCRNARAGTRAATLEHTRLPHLTTARLCALAHTNLLFADDDLPTALFVLGQWKGVYRTQKVAPSFNVRIRPSIPLPLAPEALCAWLPAMATALSQQQTYCFPWLRILGMNATQCVVAACAAGIPFLSHIHRPAADRLRWLAVHNVDIRGIVVACTRAALGPAVAEWAALLLRLRKTLLFRSYISDSLPFLFSFSGLIKMYLSALASGEASTVETVRTMFPLDYRSYRELWADVAPELLCDNMDMRLALMCGLVDAERGEQEDMLALLGGDHTYSFITVTTEPRLTLHSNVWGVLFQLRRARSQMASASACSTPSPTASPTPSPTSLPTSAPVLPSK